MRESLVLPPVRALWRMAMPVTVFAVSALFLASQLSMDVVLALPERLADIPAHRWVLALVFTVGSFWAVAQYDALAHRALQTGVSSRRARISGAVGVALGQTLGFGVVTGACARWRMLSDITFGQAARISVFVSVSFMVCWVVLTAIACLVLPAPDWARWPALVVFLGVLPLPALLFFRPIVKALGVTLHLPSLRVSGAILFWALMDTVLAAAVLFVLLPVGSLPFAEFAPLFLIALGGGLISNTPGGVGPFELVLLSAVPQVDPATIAAGILGFRLIYFALPALCAALALLRPPEPRECVAAPVAHRPVIGARSEVQVVAQNGGSIATRRGCTLALWPTAQTVTLFTDPITGPCDAGLSQVRSVAQDVGKLAMIYKCDARTATTARARRWRVLHMADEAIVDLAAFDADVPGRRTLRRKLRAAHKAGVTVHSDFPLPQLALAQVDAQWQAAHGAARGGSMGRYSPDYVEGQWVGCAFVKHRLVGFITVHRGPTEWCLDIMRHGDDLPDGAMHALVTAAIHAARNAGASRLSLAATPACPVPQNRIWRWVTFVIAHKTKGRGLRQFKSAFAPAWVPRYAAAKSWCALLVGLADIARTIQNPDPLARRATSQPHNLDENYELDSIKAA